MTLCRSTTSRQLAQRQSRHRHSFLWPFRHDTTPWFRHLAHLGVRRSRRDAGEDFLLLLPEEEGDDDNDDEDDDEEDEDKDEEGEEDDEEEVLPDDGDES